MTLWLAHRKAAYYCGEPAENAALTRIFGGRASIPFNNSNGPGPEIGPYCGLDIPKERSTKRLDRFKWRGFTGISLATPSTSACGGGVVSAPDTAQAELLAWIEEGRKLFADIENGRYGFLIALGFSFGYWCRFTITSTLGNCGYWWFGRCFTFATHCFAEYSKDGFGKAVSLSHEQITLASPTRTIVKC